jgi:hypothetical protein
MAPVTNTLAYHMMSSMHCSLQNQKEFFSIECCGATFPISDSPSLSLSKWHWDAILHHKIVAARKETKNSFISASAIQQW